MLSVKHQTNNGTKIYSYDTINGKSLSSYMSEWQRAQRRKQRQVEGLPEFIHAHEVPSQTAKMIVEMRDLGKSWSHISRKFNFTDYIVRKVYSLHKRI
jgi:hypothetical protein